eukprot:g7829.t1
MQTTSTDAKHPLKLEEYREGSTDAFTCNGVTDSYRQEFSNSEVLLIEGGGGDGGFMEASLLIPPAIPPMTATTIDVQLLDVESDAHVRLVVHRQSTVLLERVLTQSELLACKITLELPAIPEGVINFLLIRENVRSQMMTCSVPCCIVPPIIVQDINKLLLTMCSVATDLPQFPEHVTTDQTRFAWVWKKHFCELLHDVDVLFQWLDDSTEKQPSFMGELMLDMLRQCCMHEAWDFAAYVLSKAVRQGIRIDPDPFHGCDKITGESLKAATESLKQAADA